MSGVLSRLFSLGPRHERPMDYEQAKAQAADPNMATRRALAKRPDAQPEILYYLADDAAPEVRREIAANRATPVQADLILAGDGDGDVRGHVAAKIAKVAPDLTEDERDKVGSFVVDILETLARDQLPKVRRILSEELKDATNVPAKVVEMLARDDEVEVAGPVLENSPLLSDDLLIEIIDSKPVRGILGSIARRRDLGSDVSDAIVATDEEDAITALLSNSSAQIREEALDALVDRAPSVPAWHAPLVARPTLSSTAIVRLSAFVAESLLDRLRNRQDIDAETASVVSAAVRDRLEHDGPETAPEDDPEAAAERLHEEGRLTDDVIMSALERGERAFVTAALALRSGLSRTAVQKAISLESTKGITAISWKAGLTMAQAVQFQLRLGRIAPSKVLRPRDNGGFPLPTDEMDWQLEFFES